MEQATKGRRYYLAYGEYMSLLQMARKCETAVRVGKSSIRGWRLSFNGEAGNGVENIVPCYNQTVPITIWRVALEDEMELDKRYNYGIAYTKLEFRVVCNNESYIGFTYILNSPMPSALPSPQLKDIMKEGYSDNDIPIADWDSSFF